jgi:ATP-dependent Clp protease adaptor protein ClpS
MDDIAIWTDFPGNGFLSSAVNAEMNRSKDMRVRIQKIIFPKLRFVLCEFCIIAPNCHSMVKEKQKSISEEKGLLDSNRDLILYNDETHSFDFVIQTLIDVCDLESLQAEQCTYIAHYKGKCAIKSGNLTELKPKYEELTRRGLTASID